MKRPKRDPVREDRIHNEAIVDASPDEQAMSWYYYLESKISFPFQARCVAAKDRLAAQERRNHGGRAHGRWKKSASTTCSCRSVGRGGRWPFRSLNWPPSIRTNQPQEAIGDWHYWVAQGCCSLRLLWQGANQHQNLHGQMLRRNSRASTGWDYWA